MRIPTGGRKMGGAGCLVLFALPFVGIGVLMSYLTASTVWTWREMQQWVEVPAVVLKAELEVNSDSDGDTYRAAAQYRYTYEGREYTSDRVCIDSGSDNIGSFHQDAHRELAQYAGTDTPFRCFVNPNEPSEAVLYRRLRPEMLMLYGIFGLVFGGAGIGMICFAVYGWKTVRADDHLRERFPGQPWQWNQAWAKGTVTCSTRTAAAFAVVFAGFWNLISFSLAIFIVPQALREDKAAGLLVLLFPAVGIALAAWAIVAAMRWLKYGDSIFQMAAVPGVIGGQLAGVIHTNVNLRPEECVKLVLSCIRSWTTGSGKNRETRESVLWQDSREIQRESLQQGMARSAIPVQFTIPFDAQGTSDDDPNDRILWRLEAEAATAGVDYKAQFEVPVFKTADSREDFVAHETPLAAYQTPSELDEELRAAGILRTTLVSGGRRYEFPMARLKGTAAIITVFFAIWVGAIVLMVVVGAPILFTAVFCFFGFLIGCVVLDLWFGAQRLEANFQVLTVTSSMLGFAKKRAFYYADIEAVKVSSDMQSGNKTYYSVEITTTDGGTYSIAKHIPDRKHAGAIAADLESALSGK
ncbi:MAG TPA: DUF3592 domain-containing protein [Candidatus Hydrogenedentes bacterium]|nr:DUF3592 domain-containing protein [Candidatus Hydrogenedentota bacterium]HQH52982.1 DUF3592 domain-containing protein [Candidatus Hydrogenedentota bacterium]